jgi:hypothetical protein
VVAIAALFDHLGVERSLDLPDFELDLDLLGLLPVVARVFADAELALRLRLEPAVDFLARERGLPRRSRGARGFADSLPELLEFLIPYCPPPRRSMRFGALGR